MKIKLLFLVLIGLSMPRHFLAQSNYVDFINTSIIGINLVDEGDILNSRNCQFSKEGITYNYSPSEVNEYGFKDGRVYVSKAIHITNTFTKRVFLLRLVKSNTSLYYYKSRANKTFYIEKDSTLFMELPKLDREDKKINFHNKLLVFTSDCQNVSDATKLVTYSKKSLSELIRRYNNCELKPFPFFKYGTFLGYGISKISSSPKTGNTYLNKINFKFDPGFILGLFIDYPISFSNFSLHTELQYSKNRYLYNWIVENKENDLLIKTTALSSPLLLRYSYPSKKIRPFINSGFIYSYYLKNDNILDVIISKGDLTKIIETSESKYFFTSKNLVGFSIGGGTQYELNCKNIVSIELRYEKLLGTSEFNSSDKNSFQVISSINF